MVFQAGENLERLEEVLPQQHCVDGVGEQAALQSHVCILKNKYINGVSPMPVHMHPFVIHRSLVGLEDAQTVQESLALEAMIFDNDQGFFGGS